MKKAEHPARDGKGDRGRTEPLPLQFSGDGIACNAGPGKRESDRSRRAERTAPGTEPPRAEAQRAAGGPQRNGGSEEPGDAGPPAPALLVGVDVADGDGGEGQLLKLHGDGHGRAVVVQKELGALPEDQPHGAQRQQDPDEPAQPPAGHHDAAAAVRVGVEAVPAHQLAQRGRLRAAHRQRLLDAGGDLLPGGHGCERSSAVSRGRPRESGAGRCPPSHRSPLLRLGASRSSTAHSRDPTLPPAAALTQRFPLPPHLMPSNGVFFPRKLHRPPRPSPRPSGPEGAMLLPAPAPLGWRCGRPPRHYPARPPPARPRPAPAALRGHRAPPAGRGVETRRARGPPCPQ